MSITSSSHSRIKLPRRQSSVAGFTIIELMISLSVLSLILLLSTYGIVQIGKMYAKGMNQTNTQNAARNIMNNIASQIQLGGATPLTTAPSPAPTTSASSGVGVLCIGSKRYSFTVNHKLTKDKRDHALWLDVMNGSSTCPRISPLTPFTAPTDANNTSSPNNGSELLLPNMRLTDLDIRSSNGFYTVTVGIAYGDDDLILYSPRSPGSAATATCKGGKGSEFCAIATLTQTIAPRMAE